MERAASPVVSALGLQRDIAAHYIHNVAAGDQLVQKTLGKRHKDDLLSEVSPQ